MFKKTCSILNFIMNSTHILFKIHCSIFPFLANCEITHFDICLILVLITVIWYQMLHYQIIIYFLQGHWFSFFSSRTLKKYIFSKIWFFFTSIRIEQEIFYAFKNILNWFMFSKKMKTMDDISFHIDDLSTLFFSENLNFNWIF